MAFDKAKVIIDLEEYNHLLKIRDSIAPDMINIENYIVRINENRMHGGKELYITDMTNHKELVMQKDGKIKIIDSKKFDGRNYQSTPFITLTNY